MSSDGSIKAAVSGTGSCVSEGSGRLTGALGRCLGDLISLLERLTRLPRMTVPDKIERMQRVRMF